MERQVTFKASVFGGFHKKSVLKYIDELCEQNKTALDDLNQKIADLEEKNQALLENITQLDGNIQGLEDDSANQLDQIQNLETTIANLNLEILRQQQAMEDKDRDIKAQQEKCRQLTLRAESLEHKGRKYDEAMMQIGSALMEARHSADGIIKAAEQKASRLTVTTIESIQSLAQQISTFKGDVSTLRVTLQSSMEELEQRLDAIDNSIDTLDAAVKAAEFYREPEQAVEETSAVQEVEIEPEQQPTGGKPKAQSAEFFW
ncbi:hypothetical protein [Hydrogenoanaerobacterium sp.]|uniref:hypothetical protein n=1 Tax=Hydrogenoanaerobacterium sp. TaxID=2953763 RepID=UPI00289B1734|nr:hypothetical protein [Hydrogenoanaerobacterium sp.]